MRSTDNLNLLPKHIMTSLSESPCLIIHYAILMGTNHIEPLDNFFSIFYFCSSKYIFCFSMGTGFQSLMKTSFITRSILDHLEEDCLHILVMKRQNWTQDPSRH